MSFYLASILVKTTFLWVGILLDVMYVDTFDIPHSLTLELHMCPYFQ